MSIRNINVQYIGDTLYLPLMEREVNHIVVLLNDTKCFEHFEKERTCRNIAEDSGDEFICSECGHVDGAYEYGSIVGEHCKGCGAKVVN